jgi:aminoglycoside/choline kinase family phosphotransferase
MDKWQRRFKGYRTDWPDGDYVVTNIIYNDDKGLECSRVIHIKDGRVTHPKWDFSFTQDSFFEVNKVIKQL